MFIRNLITKAYFWILTKFKRKMKYGRVADAMVLRIDKTFESINDSFNSYGKDEEIPQLYSDIEIGTLNDGSKCMNFQFVDKKYLIEAKIKLFAKSVELVTYQILWSKEADRCSYKEIPELTIRHVAKNTDNPVIFDNHLADFKWEDHKLGHGYAKHFINWLNVTENS